MKILLFSTLFPNAAQPQHGVFVENRMRQWLATGRAEVRVVAPVPWFPFRADTFGAWARFARVPAAEVRHGVPVLHPRYPVIPAIGMNVAPYLLYLWTRPTLARLRREGFDFDLIDAHYFYPDGVAAGFLAAVLDRPYVVTARGSDVNLIAQHAWPRRLIRRAAQRAAGVVTVSAALRDTLAGIGVDPARIDVLRNGVDLVRFRPPADREALRRSLRIDGPTLVSVGHLVPGKGHDLAVRAMTGLPDHRLIVIGEGPERKNLDALVRSLGLGDRVRLAGALPHESLPDHYGAADALLLMSAREGWPNVVLEAMACGTPVIATDVGGIPEIIGTPEAGFMLPERTPDALATAVRRIGAQPPDRAATRAWAEGFGWQPTVDGQLRLFAQAIEADRAGRTCRRACA